MIICPKCKKEVGNLLIHYRFSHDKSIKSKSDFYKLYPEFSGKSLQITVEKENEHLKCPYCNKEYKHQQALQAHIHNSHNENFKSMTRNTKLEFECPICKKQINGIKEHVLLSHNLDWNKFCKEYNWDLSKGRYISEEYKKKLSENKRNFYKNTERGKELKEIQSEKWMKNNPILNSNIKEKSINTRAISTKIPAKGFRGIKVFFEGKTFRSFNEFNFYINCKQHGINLEFEPSKFTVKWFNKEKGFMSSYLPDFYDISTNTVIELKSAKRDIELALNNDKYKSVKPIYEKLGINYIVTTYKKFLESKGYYLDKSYIEKEKIKDFVLKQVKQNNIHFLSPYRYSGILCYIFGVKDLSTINCVKLTKKTIQRKYYGIQKDL